MYQNISISIRCVSNMITGSWLTLFQSLLWPLKKAEERQELRRNSFVVFMSLFVLLCVNVFVWVSWRRVVLKSQTEADIWGCGGDSRQTPVFSCRGVSVGVRLFCKLFHHKHGSYVTSLFLIQTSNNRKMTKGQIARGKILLKRKSQMDLLDCHHSECYQGVVQHPLKNERSSIVFQACRKVKEE